MCEQNQEPGHKYAPFHYSQFRFVDVTTKGSEGTINLFWGEHCIAWVNNTSLAQEIKHYLSANAESDDPNEGSEE